MKHTYILIFLAIATISSCAPAEEKAPSATTEELGQMNRDFAKALTDHDAEAAANQYAEDAMLLPPGEPMVKGRADIKKYWQGGIDAGIVEASVKTLDAASDGDLGYEIGTFELKLKDSTGNIIVDKGRYTEILRRDSSGKWISVYGMWNSDPPEQ